MDSLRPFLTASLALHALAVVALPGIVLPLGPVSDPAPLAVRLAPPVAAPVPVASHREPRRLEQAPAGRALPLSIDSNAPVIAAAPEPAPAANPGDEAARPSRSGPAAPAASPTVRSTAPEAVPVSPPLFDANYLRNPAPAYPALSRRLGEQGRVVLRVRVTPAGTAEDVAVHSSSGSSRLDAAARETVRHWSFVPARRGDEALAAWVLVPISFRLDS